MTRLLSANLQNQKVVHYKRSGAFGTRQPREGIGPFVFLSPSIPQVPQQVSDCTSFSGCSFIGMALASLACDRAGTENQSVPQSIPWRLVYRCCARSGTELLSATSEHLPTVCKRARHILVDAKPFWAALYH